jgi:hypothetical protein
LTRLRTAAARATFSSQTCDPAVKGIQLIGRKQVLLGSLSGSINPCRHATISGVCVDTAGAYPIAMSSLQPIEL